VQAITLRELLEAVHGTLLGEFHDLDTEISHVDTDSRKIHPGSLFIPLVGERFDGHAYIASALEKGADGCLTARERESYLPGKFYIKVSNTQRALRDLAAWYKGQFPIPFVAVTGSVGKTTSKDMIAAVLSTRFKVLKTEGNFNNNVGLPLTLLRLEREHEICVVEMGMDRVGEIDYLADIVRPQVGIIMSIGDAHIERLGSRENILNAKCELLPYIQKEGLLLLNGDDELLCGLRGKTPVKTLFFGSGNGLDYRAGNLRSNGESHICCDVKTPAMEHRIKIPSLGDHMIYPALCAVAVGEYFGMDAKELSEGILRFVPTRMRMNVLHRAGNITILDDTYNANPQSMRAAIQVLADNHGGKKIAVLGDMFELGPFAPALHTGVGECLGKAGIDCLVAVGEYASYITEGARASGVPEVYHVQERDEAKEILSILTAADATILVKASRGMAMERLTEYLLSITEDA